MSLSRSIRDRFNIASTGALALLRGEVEKLARRVDVLSEELDASEVRRAEREEARRGEQDEHVRVLRSEIEGLRGEIQTVRGESDILRDALSELGARFDAYAERNYASADDLAALRMQFEGNGQQAETMRLKLAAVAEQLRWESEDLRKALTAVAERAERARKAG